MDNTGNEHDDDKKCNDDNNIDKNHDYDDDNDDLRIWTGEQNTHDSKPQTGGHSCFGAHWGF